jgi:hypothetical protein
MLAGRTLLEAHAAAHEEWECALAVGAIALPEAALRTPFGRFRKALETSATPPSRGPVARPNFATAANMSIERQRFLELGGFDASTSARDQDPPSPLAAGGAIVTCPGRAARRLGNEPACILSPRHGAPVGSVRRRYPDWPENRERWAVNGPPAWREDPPRRLLGKMGKRLLGLPPLLAVMLALIDLLEARAPSSRLLVLLYRLALGIHLQRGFRRGWAAIEWAQGRVEEAP